jgi:hypothetical protein
MLLLGLLNARFREEGNDLKSIFPEGLSKFSHFDHFDPPALLKRNLVLFSWKAYSGDARDRNFKVDQGGAGRDVDRGRKD